MSDDVVFWRVTFGDQTISWEEYRNALSGVAALRARVAELTECETCGSKIRSLRYYEDDTDDAFVYRDPWHSGEPTEGEHG